MVVNSKDFQIIKTDDGVDKSVLASGHATTVRRVQTLTGDVVEKHLNNATGRFSVKQEGRADWWMQKQKDAQQIADAIRAKNNPAYFIPKTYISHGKVREEFASGKSWRGMAMGMDRADKEWVYRSLAEFMNDMTELYPVVCDDGHNALPNLPVKDASALEEMLARWDDKYVGAENKKLIREIYDYLANLPENKTLVFGHNDLHSDNIIVDMDKRQVSIIDFECAGYRPAFAAMYCGTLAGNPEFWAYMNKLPRKTNPDLRWNYVPEHTELFQFLRWCSFDVVLEGVKNMASQIAEKCDKMRFVLARAKMHHQELLQQQKMPLVPVSHYDR